LSIGLRTGRNSGHFGAYSPTMKARVMGRTLPSETRKAQLLLAARKVLGEKGYSATRISEIVAEAGVSQGTFYLYFASKEDIVIELGRALVADALSEIKGNWSPDDEMETALRKVIKSYYKVCFQYKDVLEGTNGGATPGLNKGKWNEIYKPLNDGTLNMIETWQRHGSISSEADADVVSWLLIDTFNGALARLFGHSGDRVSQDYEAQVIGWTLSALKYFNPRKT